MMDFLGKIFLPIERRKTNQSSILGGSLIEAANYSIQLLASEIQNGTFVNRKSQHICRASQAIAADVGGSGAHKFVPTLKKFMGVETITLKKVTPLDPP